MYLPKLEALHAVRPPTKQSMRFIYMSTIFDIIRARRRDHPERNDCAMYEQMCVC